MKNERMKNREVQVERKVRNRVLRENPSSRVEWCENHKSDRVGNNTQIELAPRGPRSPIFVYASVCRVSFIWRSRLLFWVSPGRVSLCLGRVPLCLSPPPCVQCWARYPGLQNPHSISKKIAYAQNVVPFSTFERVSTPTGSIFEVRPVKLGCLFENCRVQNESNAVLWAVCRLIPNKVRVVCPGSGSGLLGLFCCWLFKSSDYYSASVQFSDSQSIPFTLRCNMMRCDAMHEMCKCKHFFR